MAGLFLVSPVLLLYFSYRAFTDEGGWAFLQIPLALFLGTLLSQTRWVANGLTPFLMTAWGLFIASRLWDR